MNGARSSVDLISAEGNPYGARGKQKFIRSPGPTIAGIDGRRIKACASTEFKDELACNSRGSGSNRRACAAAGCFGGNRAIDHRGRRVACRRRRGHAGVAGAALMIGDRAGGRQACRQNRLIDARRAVRRAVVGRSGRRRNESIGIPGAVRNAAAECRRPFIDKDRNQRSRRDIRGGRQGKRGA